MLTRTMNSPMTDMTSRDDAALTRSAQRQVRRIELTRLARALLIAVAFAGSAVYAGSYRLIVSASDLTSIAAAIGIAAAIAWVGFGFLLLTVAQMQPRRFATVSVWHWADVCLVSMSIGMAIKFIGVGGNVIASALMGDRVELALIAPMQLALLVFTDVVMGCIFVRLSARLGLPTSKAVMLWVVALNGIFAAALSGLLVYGGFLL